MTAPAGPLASAPRERARESLADNLIRCLGLLADPEVVATMRDCGGPAIPGALTPSEVLAAVRAGADFVKLFPASVGGVSYLRALRGPLPDVHFIPTGGIAAANVGAWLAAGAVAVGAGSELCPREAISERDYERITELAGEYVTAAARS